MSRIRIVLVGFAGVAIMFVASGCRARRVVYVPVPPPVQVVAQPVVLTTNGLPQQVIVTQQPPPPQMEVIPVSPGPAYLWNPGYWAWNGSWVWVGGGWIARPHPRAVWVGGHWTRHAHGYVWIGGRWN